jgi:hypothetical protein
MNNDRLSGPDEERNENPDTMAGAIGGAAGAGAIAGLGLAALGPLGGLIGALAGAIGGWWTGQGVLHAVEDVDRAENRFRKAYEHAGARRPYEEVRHGYQLGYLAGLNPQYADLSFADVEKDLRSAWVQAHLEEKNPVSWDEVRSDALTGFDIAREK